LGIIEYINISEFIKGKHDIKRIIFKREQYYLDMLNPTLNINKIAGSIPGYKHSEHIRKKDGFLISIECLSTKKIYNQRSLRRTIRFLKEKGINTTLTTLNTYIDTGKPFKGYLFKYLK
jgi:hypothetical protein